MEICIDAKDLIVGRLASFAAKKSLLGHNVRIFNCESAVITGRKEYLIEKFANKRDMGNPSNGPFIPRMPDRFLRRTIRGMVPYKRPKGRDAFARIMCYIGVPAEFKDKKMITVEGANVSKTRNLRFMRVKEICRSMGGKA